MMILQFALEDSIKTVLRGIAREDGTVNGGKFERDSRDTICEWAFMGGETVRAFVSSDGMVDVTFSDDNGASIWLATMEYDRATLCYNVAACIICDVILQLVFDSIYSDGIINTPKTRSAAIQILRAIDGVALKRER